MSDAAKDESAESWGCTFHRHFGSNEIHRDGGAECQQTGTPSVVYAFDPDYLREHDKAVFQRGIQAAREAVVTLLADPKIYTTETVRGVAGALFAIDNITKEA